MKTSLLFRCLIGCMLWAGLLAACTNQATPTTPTLPPSPSMEAITSTPLAPTVAPSATQQPTATSSPTIAPTHTETPIPPTPTPGIPLLGSDLLFLSQGQLKLWNQLAQQVEVLVGTEAAGGGNDAGQVLSYDVSADGRLAVLHLSGPAEDEYRLALFDLGARSLQVFYTGKVAAVGLLGLDLSADGSWIAFIPQEASLAVTENSRSGRVYVVSTTQLNSALIMGLCVEVIYPDATWGCSGLAWSTDNTSLVWSDGRGIWLVAYGAQAELLVKNNPQSARGVPRLFQPVSWSPAQSFLLTRLQYFEGSSLGITNPANGDIQEIPDTSAYTGPNSELAWLPAATLYQVAASAANDRFIVIQPGGQYGIDQTAPARAKIWSITPTGTLTLTLQQTWPLGANPADVPFGLAVSPQGEVVFLQTQLEPLADTVLYRLNLTSGALSQVCSLPHYESGSVYWLPDASGVLIVLGEGEQKSIRYAPISGGEGRDLTAFLDRDAQSFTWLP